MTYLDSSVGVCGCNHWLPRCPECHRLVQACIDIEIAQNQALGQWKLTGGVYRLTGEQWDENKRLNESWGVAHHQYMRYLHPEVYT